MVRCFEKIFLGQTGGENILSQIHNIN